MKSLDQIFRDEEELKLADDVLKFLSEKDSEGRTQVGVFHVYSMVRPANAEIKRRGMNYFEFIGALVKEGYLSLKNNQGKPITDHHRSMGPFYLSASDCIGLTDDAKTQYTVIIG